MHALKPHLVVGGMLESFVALRMTSSNVSDRDTCWNVGTRVSPRVASNVKGVANSSSASEVRSSTHGAQKCTEEAKAVISISSNGVIPEHF